MMKEWVCLQCFNCGEKTESLPLIRQGGAISNQSNGKQNKQNSLSNDNLHPSTHVLDGRRGRGEWAEGLGAERHRVEREVSRGRTMEQRNRGATTSPFTFLAFCSKKQQRRKSQTRVGIPVTTYSFWILFVTFS